jgi:hypothetical protein
VYNLVNDSVKFELLPPELVLYCTFKDENVLSNGKTLKACVACVVVADPVVVEQLVVAEPVDVLELEELRVEVVLLEVGVVLVDDRPPTDGVELDDATEVEVVELEAFGLGEESTRYAPTPATATMTTTATAIATGASPLFSKSIALSPRGAYLSQ